MVESAYSSSTEKKLDEIKKELSSPDNKYGKKIISVFQVGSTVDTVGKKPIYEDENNICWTDNEQQKLLFEFCYDLFKKVTKVKLEPGEIKKIKKITFEFKEG